MPKLFLFFKTVTALLFVVVLWQFNMNTSFARTDFLLCNNNPGTIWGVALEAHIDGDTFNWNANLNTADYYNNSFSVDYSCDKFGSNYENVLVLHRNLANDYDDNDYLKWLTSCVDPKDYSNPNSLCSPIAGGCIYEVRVDVTCKTGYPDTNNVYGGCNSPTGHGFVGSSEKCPGSGNVCVWGGRYYGICTDYCGGDTPKVNCERVNRNCTSSGCNVASRRTYAAVCNDPDGGNDGGNRCAPAPPSGRTETAFCQGTAGTDRAAGLKFNWDRIALGLERDANPYDIQFRQVGGGDLHEINGIDAATYEFPGNACTTGPGGCSLPYNKAYEWRIQAHTEPGISGPTDWGGWRKQTTNDCSGKPDLKITGFTFPSGNSAGTTDATVTITNSGYSGTGGAFDVKAHNGNAQSAKSINTNGLAVDTPRTVTIPNIARPNAGSYTATAIVDPNDNGTNNTDDISEVDENNNSRDANYTVTSNIGGIIFIDNNPQNGVRDNGESLYTQDVTIRVGSSNVTATAGTYKSNELNAGTYDVSMPTVPGNHTLTTPSSVETTLGPNRTVNFGLRVNQSNIIINVFEDYDGNGAFDSTVGNQDKVYQGASVTVTGQGAGTYTTNVNGRITLSNLNPGNSTITLNIPANYSLTTPKLPAPNNAITITIPPAQTENFGIQPPVPYCSGGLTATGSTVSVVPGNTSTLRCVNPISPNGDAITYTWSTPDVGTVNKVNSPTTTWFVPPSSSTATSAHPIITLCYTGTNRCRSHTTTITLTYPAPPYCANGLTASPNSLTPGPGVTSALTCNNPISPSGEPITYTWGTPNIGTVNAVNSPSSTWNSPVTASAPTANVNVTLCYQGTARCTTSNASITMVYTSNITVNVFKDYDNNGVWDTAGGDEAYQGATVTATGIASAGSPYTTNVNGRVSMLNLEPGSSTITLTIPAGYRLSTPKPPAPDNAITVDIPPAENINFGLWPINGPSCAGGLTATPSTVDPGTGVTSQLRCVNPTSPTGDPLTYTWFSDGTGTVDQVNSAVSTWRSPATTTNTATNPSVRVCYQGTNRCSSSTTTINLVTLSTITGNVYIDTNQNGRKDAGESNYTGNITITANPVNGSSSTDTNGAYTISNLPSGNYTISYTGLPANYRISYPQNGPPPNFTVRLGSQAICAASIAGYNSASCTNGNIANLNFGIITNDGPWVQTGGSDIWFNSGYPYTIPSGASCQSYASLLGASGTPGIIYTGVGSDSFGSGQASQNPYNWKVGGISSYSENYGPASLGSPLATSYSYVRNLAITNGTPPTTLTSTHCGAGGITNCNLSSTLASGIYEASGNLTLANNYAFPANRDYVILVSGNLRLNGTIDVPVGSTVLFSVQGNIYVDSSVGTSTITSTTPHLEGWFSTDRSFYIEGDNTCPTSDNRLNMEGALVVNASLLGGSFYNLRDLCSGNSNCPVFYIKERPDFSLNAPRFIKNAPRVYKEVAP